MKQYKLYHSICIQYNSYQIKHIVIRSHENWLNSESELRFSFKFSLSRRFSQSEIIIFYTLEFYDYLPVFYVLPVTILVIMFTSLVITISWIYKLKHHFILGLHMVRVQNYILLYWEYFRTAYIYPLMSNLFKSPFWK